MNVNSDACKLIEETGNSGWKFLHWWDWRKRRRRWWRRGVGEEEKAWEIKPHSKKILYIYIFEKQKS